MVPNRWLIGERALSGTPRSLVPELVRRSSRRLEPCYDATKKIGRLCSDEPGARFERGMGNRARFAGAAPLTPMGEPSQEELLRTLESHYFGPEMQERAEIEALPVLLSGVRTFVDVGAALGQYTFFANKAMQGGIIYAIEADPVRASRLGQLSKEWKGNTGSNEIVVLNQAISDSVGKCSFFVTDGDRSGGLFPVDGLPGTGAGSFDWREITVEATTLDALFEGRPPPDLVKIDIEGGEYRALQGAEGMLREGRTRFMVEVHPWGDPTIRKRASDVFDLMAGFHYDFRRLHHHWLFARSGATMIAWAKNRLIHLVFDHPVVTGAVRRVMRATTGPR
jgi:FkbM family methyltransferase